ncbi:DotG/IcmE/VirB10 family protein [Acidithiobacillus sp.]|uniref:DotG/IcmE/VirB10 family protein n=1 Tax=Acidithiobacillus sp. TaxID=1872118 RepID=UPI003CFDDEC2
MTEDQQQPQNPDNAVSAPSTNPVTSGQSGLASAAEGSAQTGNVDAAVAGADTGNNSPDVSADSAQHASDTPLPRRPGVLRRTLSDPHQRPLVIGAATLGVGVMVAAVILLMPAHHSEISQAGQATQMRPIPGGSSSARYKAQLAAYNAAQAKRAAARHQSELPTMGSLHKVAQHKKPPKPQAPPPYHPPARTTVHYGPNPYAKAIQAEVTALMTESTAATLSAYAILPNPALLKVRARTPADHLSQIRSAVPPAPLLANAGHISFAVLDTAIKSTEPGPVLATIETGRFAGARLLGGFARVHDRVLVKFSSMDWQHHTVPITATAITLRTARTALATSVNRHTLYRYGWLIGASLLQGVNDALEYANTSTYLTGSGLGVVTHQLDNGQIALSAVGNVGQTLAPIMANRFNTPPTVRVRSGTGIGVLFMAPVKGPKQGSGE